MLAGMDYYVLTFIKASVDGVKLSMTVINV